MFDEFVSHVGRRRLLPQTIELVFNAAMSKGYCCISKASKAALQSSELPTLKVTSAAG